MVAAAWYPGVPPANRVALEAMIKPRNEGRDYRKEAQDILKAAAKKSRELDVALGHLWRYLLQLRVDRHARRGRDTDLGVGGVGN